MPGGLVLFETGAARIFGTRAGTGVIRRVRCLPSGIRPEVPAPKKRGRCPLLYLIIMQIRPGYKPEDQ